MWRGDNFGPPLDSLFRSTPVYADGRLYTVVGSCRTVAPIDPASGETLWTFREPHTGSGGTAQPSHATPLVTRTLLMYGEGRGGRPLLHAVDKTTGARVGSVELPATSTAPPMTFVDGGRQYIVLAVAGQGHLGSLVALRLP